MKTLAEIGYEAYREAACGPHAKTWQEMTDSEIDRVEEVPGWEAAALAIQAEILERAAKILDEAERKADAMGPRRSWHGLPSFCFNPSRSKGQAMALRVTPEPEKRLQRIMMYVAAIALVSFCFGAITTNAVWRFK